MRPRDLITWILSLALVAYFGVPVVAAHAGGKTKNKTHGGGNGHDDDRGDNDFGSRPTNSFALFDGSNPLNQPDAGAVCGAFVGPYTYHLAVANYGSDGFVRLTYADGDWVQFPIAARASFSLSQAGGSRGGDDRAVRISNGASAAQLAGTMSAENARCTSCDADGGVGDAGCDAFVPN